MIRNQSTCSATQQQEGVHHQQKIANALADPRPDLVVVEAQLEEEPLAPVAPFIAGEQLADYLKDLRDLDRSISVSHHFFREDELQPVIKQRVFCVKELAAHFGLSMRTLERRFEEQFHMTPKAWMMHERMALSLPLLAEGCSNKQVAASLNYTCESNFCRAFKRYFGCPPQQFAQIRSSASVVSRFDMTLSHCDRRVELPGQSV